MLLTANNGYRTITPRGEPCLSAWVKYGRPTRDSSVANRRTTYPPPVQTRFAALETASRTQPIPTSGRNLTFDVLWLLLPHKQRSASNLAGGVRGRGIRVTKRDCNWNCYLHSSACCPRGSSFVCRVETQHVLAHLSSPAQLCEVERNRATATCTFDTPQHARWRLEVPRRLQDEQPPRTELAGHGLSSLSSALAKPSHNPK